jgi:hypothetical protein
MKVWRVEGEHEKDMKFRCSKLYQKVRKKTREIYYRVMLRSENKKKSIIAQAQIQSRRIHHRR